VKSVNMIGPLGTPAPGPRSHNPPLRATDRDQPIVFDAVYGTLGGMSENMDG